MVKLNSVGAILDRKTDMVYPQNSDGTPDLSCGVFLQDCRYEWFKSLSEKDRKIVSQYK